MQVVKQIAMFLKNEPGVLAKVCRELAAQGVNIVGISVQDAVDHAVVRMVTSDPKRAVHVIGDSGVLAIESDVLAIPLADNPGELAKIAARLARAKINIDYAYGSSSDGEKKTVLYVKVSDIRKAKKVLG